MIGIPLGLSAATLILSTVALAQRARDLGIPFEGTPGPLNAITDIAGVEVGHKTLLEGDSIRTGVTVVWPRGKSSDLPSFGAWFSQNGNGEMTGTAWVEESGFVDGPIAITNTHSVGTVRDAYIQWQVKNRRKPATNSFGNDFWSLPIVAETYDGFLNDINGQHVKPEDVFHALENASPGAVPEGNVGGGTGMICFGFKGGIGTSSRIVGGYHIGALVQCNCGSKRQLRIGGVPVGQKLDKQSVASAAPKPPEDLGSIIIVIATDAPLLPSQMKRVARRATLGLGRMGAISSNGSGDLFIAFSTANPQAGKPGSEVAAVSMLPNEALSPIFEATVQAVEESITNALVAAKDMTGNGGHSVKALPHDQLRQLLKQYNRLSP